MLLTLCLEQKRAASLLHRQLQGKSSLLSGGTVSEVKQVEHRINFLSSHLVTLFNATVCVGQLVSWSVVLFVTADHYSALITLVCE